MVRNIPGRYTREILLTEFGNAGFEYPGMIDFFHMPVDHSNGRNLGYAFVNFASSGGAPAAIVSFYRLYFGRPWRSFNDSNGKVCHITYARVQGSCEHLNTRNQ